MIISVEAGKAYLMVTDLKFPGSDWGPSRDIHSLQTYLTAYWNPRP